MEQNTVLNQKGETEMTHGNLVAHTDTSHISRDALATIPCPMPEGRWKPIPHAELVSHIEDFVLDSGWDFTKPEESRFALSVSADGQKMFGVTEVLIPGIETVEGGYGLALGFRNSHNKTMAVRLAVGSHVFVCDNMCFSGEVVIGRKHTIHLEVEELLETAFDRLPDVAQRMTESHMMLKGHAVNFEQGAVALLRAVEQGALSTRDLMGAFADWNRVCAGDTEGAKVEHPFTAWSLMNTITGQWKGRNPLGMLERSRKVQGLLQGISSGLVLEPKYALVGDAGDDEED